jgi:hypothetical protein
MDIMIYKSTSFRRGTVTVDRTILETESRLLQPTELLDAALMSVAIKSCNTKVQAEKRCKAAPAMNIKDEHDSVLESNSCNFAPGHLDMSSLLPP